MNIIFELIGWIIIVVIIFNYDKISKLILKRAEKTIKKRQDKNDKYIDWVNKVTNYKG